MLIELMIAFALIGIGVAIDRMMGGANGRR
jgi:hypothetical protein